jgi:hypothetical protein
VKCSGGKLFSWRVPVVRSTFDWAVCSEPLAVCGGRGYGDGMVEFAGLGSDEAGVRLKSEVVLKWQGRI